MKFINIIVHSAKNMNFRVHLQNEFALLGLDDYLNNKLRFNDNDKLKIEIQVYFDNQLDVQELLEEAELKCIKEKELIDLNEKFTFEKDKFNHILNKIAELQKQNEILMKERDERSCLNRTENISRNDQQLLKNKPALSCMQPSVPTTLCNIPPPPLPPPLAFFSGFNSPTAPTMPIKNPIETKFELPNFNWTPLRPQQILGTIFCEFNNEESLLNKIDFHNFEDLFKIGMVNKTNLCYKIKRVEKLSLLKKEQQQNIGK